MSLRCVETALRSCWGISRATRASEVPHRTKSYFHPCIPDGLGSCAFYPGIHTKTMFADCLIHSVLLLLLPLGPSPTSGSGVEGLRHFGNIDLAWIAGFVPAQFRAS
jgi:hypothetical protein